MTEAVPSPKLTIAEVAPPTRLSAYDNPDPLPGDPMPLEGDEPLTPMQLAHYRIEHDIAFARDIQKADSVAWRTAFNNLATNVRGLLNAFDTTLKREQTARLDLAAKVSKLEKKTRGLR